MLPIELLSEIAHLLSPTDRRTFSLASRLARSVALPFIFGFLSYCGDLTRKVECINQAGGEIKAVIKKLSLSEAGEVAGDELVIFHFLESLPNLESFSYIRWKSSRVDRPSFDGIIASLRFCPLRAFEFHFYPGQDHSGPGPSRLQTLNLYSYAARRMGVTRDQYMYLFKLIQPSFTTLAELTIHLSPNGKGVKSVPFDLRQLKPVGATLRSFTYFPAVLDVSILDTIPETFPLLSKLDITLLKSMTEDGKSGSHWKNVLSLAKNLNLQHLKIFTDFRVTDCEFNHWSGRQCSQCFEYFHRATQTLALACRKLERCYWITILETHVFDVISDLGSDERVVQHRHLGPLST